MIILGINAFHADAAACVLVDGRVVAAAEEERFLRIKHVGGFPARSVASCLELAGITLDQVTHLAVNRDPWAAWWRKGLYVLARRPSLSLLWERRQAAGRWLSLGQHLAQAFPKTPFTGAIHRVEHHLAHLASAYYGSGWEGAAVASVDGFGDFSSAAWGVGRGGGIGVQGRIHFPHSLGIFYQAMTQFLGFPHYGDEYKVMGLAAFGEPEMALDSLVALEKDGRYRLHLSYFRHHRVPVHLPSEHGEPRYAPLYSQELTTLLGPPREAHEPLTDRHRALAASVQAHLEKALFHLLEGHLRACGERRLCLAGGVGQNSLANGRLLARGLCRELYVPPAAADNGGALGAAMWVHARLCGKRPGPLTHAFLGPAFDHRACAQAIAREQVALEQAGVVVAGPLDEEALLGRVVSCLLARGVVGWFQGPMEFGPRALGGRSILADPRLPDMQEHLNRKIKRREPFRPLAPSVLAEQVGEWFTLAHASPFMSRVQTIRPEKRPLIPAVTHVDGTGRPQAVTAADHPLYYRLIERFHAATGVPMVLNTSFNESEPMVATPGEALACFLRTRMDALALGPYILVRRTVS